MGQPIGAWDEPGWKSEPDECEHNFAVSSWGTTPVDRCCVRCGTRESLNVHRLALIGEPAQWRGREKNPCYQPMIDPTATVGAYTCIDAGCERPTVVGKNTIIQKQVHLGHGVQVGMGCDIATGTVIAGEVTIGDFVRIGIGALISPYVCVGSQARIGAGAVVVKDVEPGAVVVGNPAKLLRKLNQAEVDWVCQRVLECTT